MKDGPVYLRTDSHWNQKGAVLAFNAAMEAAGRPDLVVPLAEAIGPLQPHPTGDLARYLGEASPRGDRDYAILTPPPAGKAHAHYRGDAGAAGKRPVPALCL